MVFALSWISFYRTNTIRNLSIYLSIYLSIFDLQRSFLLPVDLNAEGVEVEPEEPWHQVQVHRRQGGRARVSNEGAIKLFSRRTFPLRVDTSGSYFS